MSRHMKPRSTGIAAFCLFSLFATQLFAQQHMPGPFPPAERDPDRPSPRDVRMSQLHELAQIQSPGPVFAKFKAPQGAKFTFFGEAAKPLPFGNEAMVGLRSRHRYAFAIEGLTDRIENRVYGSIEVVRGPCVPEGIRGIDFPIPVVFTSADVVSLITEQMLTKVVLLEAVDKAFVDHKTPDETTRYDVASDVDPFAAAKDLGKILLIVRLGNRVPSEDELAGIYVAGSLMIPKGPLPTNGTISAANFVYADTGTNQAPSGGIEQATHRRRSAPPSANAYVSGFGSAPNCGAVPGEPGCASCDPRIGRMNPSCLPVDEFVCDGGDRRFTANYSSQGVLINVDPEDTIGVYRNDGSTKKFAKSNRVCIYSPRYAEVCQTMLIEGLIGKVVPIGVEQETVFAIHQQDRKVAQNGKNVRLQAVTERERASGFLTDQQPAVTDNLLLMEQVENRMVWSKLWNREVLSEHHSNQQPMIRVRVDRLQVESSVASTRAFAMAYGLGQVQSTWQPETITQITDRKLKPSRLLLEKSTDKKAALVGEEVTFTIKYSNTGDEILGEVLILDSLSERLEFIPKSDQSSRPAKFSTTKNTVGSDVLSWKLNDILKKGESGTVTFKARIK